MALNNKLTIPVAVKHLLKMGCSSNIPPKMQEIPQHNCPPLPYQAVKSFKLTQKRNYCQNIG